MRDAPSRSNSSSSDSAASHTTPQSQPAQQGEPAQPTTPSPPQPAAESADPLEAERARGTQLYQQGNWQVSFVIQSPFHCEILPEFGGLTR